MPETALKHDAAANKEDEALRQEAAQHLAQAPSLQLMAEVLVKLRGLGLSWWTPDHLRVRFGARTRLEWFAGRPDLRQEITTALTGLAPNAARRKLPEFQAALIDSVIDDGDISTQQFEGAFDPRDLVIYGAANDYWHELMARLPWDEDTTVHHELVAWLLAALLAEKSAIAGLSRKPILTAYDVRSSIDRGVWHSRLPLDVKVAIDDARLARERDMPNEQFRASDELEIATPTVLTTHIPLRELAPVFKVAERALGFGAAEDPLTTGWPSFAPPSLEVIDPNAKARPQQKPGTKRTTAEPPADEARRQEKAR